MLLDPSPLQCLLVCLLLAPREVLSNDGFMQDFFSRFPNLPFGNMKSFKFLHDRGSMPVSNKLLTDNDDFSSFGFHHIKKRKNEFSNLPKSQDMSVTVSVNEVHSTTTKSTISKGKQRILFSKRKSKKSYQKKTTVKPSIKLTTKSYLRGSTVDRLKYYNDFKIVSTTPVYGEENQLAKYGSPKPSFYFYQDNFSSRHHIYHDDFFATQMDKPKELADQQFFAYDPFLQSQPSTERPEDTTLESHFYYGDLKPRYKVRNKKKRKKGIVINEKAASGDRGREVHNLLEAEGKGETKAPAELLTEVTPTSTTSTTTTDPPTSSTSTTTVHPTSVSELPRLLPYQRKTRLYHYRHPNTGLMYSPLHYKPMGYDEFLPVPASSTASTSRPRYSQTTVTTGKPRFGPPARLVVTEVVMPPYTPDTNTTNTTNITTTTTSSTATTVTTTESVYFTPEYSAEDFTQFTETETAGDIGRNNSKTSHDNQNKYSYSYKVLQGHVTHMDGDDGGDDKYSYTLREPPSPVSYPGPNLPPRRYGPPYYPPPPPPPPPPSPSPSPSSHPYPFYSATEQSAYSRPEYKYHSKIRYGGLKEKGPTLKYKYSTPVKVSKAGPKKYLPHNQIIKATFFEDVEEEEEEEEEDSTKDLMTKDTVDDSEDEVESVAEKLDSKDSKYPTRFKRKKHPLFLKPYRKSSKYLRNIDRVGSLDYDENFEDGMFQANLRRIMQNQFSVRPSDYLSGFVPVNSHEKQRNYGGKNVDLEKVNANTKINNSRKPSSAWSATTKSPLHTTKLFARNKLRAEERQEDLRDNYLDLSEREGKEGNDLLSVILQKYRKKHNKLSSKQTTTKKSGVRTSKGAAFSLKSPVQSIKENLLDRFLKHFRKKPTPTPTPVRKTSPAASKTEAGPEPSRLPQSFLHEFEKKGSKDSIPPSSQDSYRNFLRKLSQQGRNES